MLVREEEKWIKKSLKHMQLNIPVTPICISLLVL